MPNLLTKLIFFLKRPRIIIVVGRGRFCATEAISRVLEKYFKVARIEKIDLKSILKNEILVLESEIKGAKAFKFFVEESKLAILVATHIGEIHPDQDFFAGEKEDAKGILKLAKILPERNSLILNFDDETIREIKDLTNLKTLTFGFQEGADFQATDIKLNTGTNFKLNYQGNIVPVWLDYLFGKEHIYSALSAISVGISLDLNLVEISQTLKFYKSLPGKK